MLPLERQNTLREQYRQARPGWRPATEVYAALVRERLRPESRVLDLGCGRGGLVEQLEHPLAQITGVDPDIASLRQHRLPLPRVQGRSNRLPLASGTFELAFASWVLEHLPRPEEDLREVARVLQPGASFVFITPNRKHPLALLNHLLGHARRGQSWLVKRFYGRATGDTFPTYYRANTPKTLHRLAADAGMHLAALHAISDPTYLAFTPLLFRLVQRTEERLSPEKRLHLVGRMQKAS